MLMARRVKIRLAGAFPGYCPALSPVRRSQIDSTAKKTALPFVSVLAMRQYPPNEWPAAAILQRRFRCWQYATADLPDTLQIAIQPHTQPRMVRPCSSFPNGRTGPPLAPIRHLTLGSGGEPQYPYRDTALGVAGRTTGRSEGGRGMSDPTTKARRSGRDLGKMTSLAQARYDASRTGENLRARVCLVGAWESALAKWQHAINDASVFGGAGRKRRRAARA
jgi:hypothetical protein